MVTQLKIIIQFPTPKWTFLVSIASSPKVASSKPEIAGYGSHRKSDPSFSSSSSHSAHPPCPAHPGPSGHPPNRGKCPRSSSSSTRARRRSCATRSRGRRCVSDGYRAASSSGWRCPAENLKVTCLQRPFFILISNFLVRMWKRKKNQPKKRAQAYFLMTQIYPFLKLSPTIALWNKWIWSQFENSALEWKKIAFLAKHIFWK